MRASSLFHRDFDNEVTQVSCFHRVWLFRHPVDARHHRATFERPAQFLQLFGGAHREYLHAPVPPVAHVAVHSDFFCHILDVIAESDSLHPPRHVVSPSHYILLHNTFSLANTIQVRARCLAHFVSIGFSLLSAQREARRQLRRYRYTRHPRASSVSNQLGHSRVSTHRKSSFSSRAIAAIS